MNRLGLGLTPLRSRNRRFNPRTLFGPTDTGWLYDPSDMSTLLQDAAGTTPVTAVGQPVGLCLDKSGRGNHRRQTASLPRPTYARHPLGGIRNLLLNTGFDGAVSGSPGTAPTSWTRFIGTTGGTSTYTAGAGSLGGGSLRISVAADQHQLGRTISVAANTTYVLSAIVDITTPTGLTQILDWVNPPAGSTFAWRVNGGAIITNGNTIPSAGNNQLIEAILTVSATAGTANARFGVGIQSNATGDVTFRDIQVDVASVRSAYQRVVSAFDVTEAGQPDLYYLAYDGSDDFLSTAPFAWGSDKATVVAGVRKLLTSGFAPVAEFGTDVSTTNGSFALFGPFGASIDYGFFSRGTALRSAQVDGFQTPITNILTGIGDIGGDRATIRVNGTQVAQSTADQGAGNFGTYPVFFGARGGTSLFFRGNEYPSFGINRLLTANELSQLERWTAQKTGVTIASPFKAYALGDSTVAAFAGGTALMQLFDTGYTEIDLSVPGHTIAQQKTAWVNQTIVADETAWVIMQIGLNDLAPAEAASVAIARLQDLADTIKAEIGSKPLLIAQMIPCRQRLINLYGATDGPIAYQKWLDMNAAIAGLGPTPITGVQGRITEHVPLMDDGNGNLRAGFDTGDGIHPNNAGRQVNVTAWRNALGVLGL